MSMRVMSSNKLWNRKQTIEALGSRWVYEHLRQTGELEPARHAGIVAGKPRPLFSSRTVARLAAARKPPGGDWLTVLEAMDEFRFQKKTLYSWVKWCPTLDRAIGKLEWNGVLYLSRQDLETCRRLLRNGCEGVPVPGNVGLWTSRGIYRTDKRTLVTPSHVERQFGIDSRLVRHWVNNPKQIPGGKTLHSEDVKKPSHRNAHGGKVLVVDLHDIEQIHAWRRGGGGAGWREDGLHDAGDGELWATDIWLQKKLEVSGIFAPYWRKKGKLHREKVWKPHDGKGGRAHVYVYSLADVREILERTQSVDPLARRRLADLERHLRRIARAARLQDNGSQQQSSPSSPPPLMPAALNAQATAQTTYGTSAGPDTTARKRRGRPKGKKGASAKERREKAIAMWDAGERDLRKIAEAIKGPNGAALDYSTVWKYLNQAGKLV